VGMDEFGLTPVAKRARGQRRVWVATVAGVAAAGLAAMLVGAVFAGSSGRSVAGIELPSISPDTVTRATGLVSLATLCATALLGTATARRFARSRWPRFAVVTLHRNLSLLAVASLGLHVSSAALDSSLDVRWVDLVIPFVSDYEPLWIGFGAVALDLVIAVLATSLVRTYVPLRLWRTIHWAGYALFAVATAHILGIGGDIGRRWVAGWIAGCVLAVAAAAWWRLSATHPDTQARQRARARRMVRK
jgi:methionine sulfoxide reductase heme-binding subunit